MKEYLVLLPIDRIAAGASYPPGQPLPLHCTLMHWFSLGSYRITPAELHTEMMRLACSEQGSIELVSSQPALFGPHNEVPVHVLEHNPDLNVLHTRFLLFLAKWYSAPKEIRWVGAGYRAHVTDCKDCALRPGERHRATHLALIERGEDKTRVVKNLYRLGEIPF